MAGVQQSKKKQWLKDESRYGDELCCPSLYFLAKLMAKLGVRWVAHQEEKM